MLQMSKDLKKNGSDKDISDSDLDSDSDVGTSNAVRAISTVELLLLVFMLFFRANYCKIVESRRLSIR